MDDGGARGRGRGTSMGKMGGNRGKNTQPKFVMTISVVLSATIGFKLNSCICCGNRSRSRAWLMQQVFGLCQFLLPNLLTSLAIMIVEKTKSYIRSWSVVGFLLSM